MANTTSRTEDTKEFSCARCTERVNEVISQNTVGGSEFAFSKVVQKFSVTLSRNNFTIYLFFKLFFIQSQINFTFETESWQSHLSLKKKIYINTYLVNIKTKHCIEYTV